MTERTPPQDSQLETCVLGGIMLEPQEAYPLAADILSPPMFYQRGHGLIFRLMGELHARGIPPEIEAVLAEVRARDLESKVGGAGYVMNMMNQVPTAANVEFQARQVADRYYLREIIKLGHLAINASYDQEKPAIDVAAILIKRAEKILQGASHDRAVNAGDAVGEVMAGILARKATVERYAAEGKSPPRLLTGLSTGLVGVDNCIRGLRPKELTIIGARPSEGKTALAINMLLHLANRQRVPVAFFSLEMAIDTLTERILSLATAHTDPTNGGWTGISTTRFEVPQLSEHESKQLERAHETIKDLPIHWVEAADMDLAQIRAQTRRLQREHGVKVIFLDYMQLLIETADNRAGSMAVISRALKRMAMEFNLAVVGLVQFRRDIEHRKDKRPTLSDAKESGSIEQDADNFLAIYRTDIHEDAAGQSEIHILKARNGPTGVEPVWLVKDVMLFASRAEVQYGR